MAYTAQEVEGISELGDKDPVVMEKGVYGSDADSLPLDDDGNEGSHPTEEEKNTLRKVAGKIPNIAYWLCAVEFAERASYYGVKGLFTNFINFGLPEGGNGLGAPPRGTEKHPGALGKGQQTATSISQSFAMMVYALPVLFGWLADTKTGRFRLIWWGIIVCAVAHLLMVGASAPSLLASGKAFAPFIISVYTLAIGAAMFKPNISPTLLDQMPVTIPVAKILKTGEKVIVDPEATTERVMLWFYQFINIGGMMSVPTTYIERYHGFWLAYFIPTLLYVGLLPMLLFLKKRLILKPPGGSDLGNVVRIVGMCIKRGGLKRLVSRQGDFFAAAKPSVIAQSSHPIEVPWTDGFVEDVRRAFQATGIFMFFPIQMINDNGLGEAANFTTGMLTAKGVPNDVMNNFNTLIIIICVPIMNLMLYPWLRKKRIHYGPIAQITTGFFIATLGGLGYTLINHFAYKTGPCGSYGTSEKRCTEDGLVAPISLWWMALPYALGGLSEIFVNVPAYGIAYARAPPNMRGLVSAINLFSSAISYAIGLMFTSLIRDPYLTWVFGIPTILGAISTVVFWFMYKDLDKEEFSLVSASEMEDKERSH